MRTTYVWITLTFMALAPLAAQTEKAEKSLAQEEELGSAEEAAPSLAEKSSYAIGVNFGRTLAAQGVPVDPTKLVDGIEDGLSSADTWLTDEEMRSAVQELQLQVAAAQKKRAAALSEKNQKESEAFLAAHSEKLGVVTLASGLQYEVLTSGDGPTPVASDTVTVHYRGTLIDGTVFDSSYDRGEPATFPLKGVIAGWTEGLQRMPVGSKWKLYIPADLAYGATGRGPTIGPSAALIFEVELLEIVEAEAAEEPKAEEADD